MRKTFSILMGLALAFLFVWAIMPKQEAPNTQVAQSDEVLPSPEEFVDVEVMPVMVNMQAPVYPSEARDAGIEGRAVVRALVGKDGRVIKTIYFEGPEVFAASACNAVANATFKPALHENAPIAVWVAVPLQYSLS